MAGFWMTGSTTGLIARSPSTTATATRSRGIQPLGGEPEVEAKHGGRDDQLRLTLTNKGSAAVRLTVTDAYHKQPARTYLVRPNADVTATVGIDATNNWYDVSAVSAQDGAFLRRLAGHVETGHPSTSDPAIG
jgi:phospholipase C